MFFGNLDAYGTFGYVVNLFLSGTVLVAEFGVLLRSSRLVRHTARRASAATVERARRRRRKNARR